MLTIKIDNPELEQTLQELYGNQSDSIAGAFREFLLNQRIKQDVAVSVQQLDSGQGMDLHQAIRDTRAKYEP